ncbi:uncharacterized protein LOC144102050 isoform X1 [Amblyomma americanum]
MPATAPVSSRPTATHRGLPVVPEPVPGSQQRMLPPARARGVSSAVATHPGGAPNANNTGITSTGAWTWSLYDERSQRRRLLDPYNAAATPNQPDVMGDQCARCGLICARTSAWCPCRWRLSLLREYIFGGCHSTCCDGFYAHGCSREQRQRPTSAIQPAGSILLSGLVARALMAFMAMAIAACQTEAEFHNPVSSGC